MKVNHQCGECGTTFETMGGIETHISYKHEDVDTNAQGLNKHLKGMFKCDECSFISMNEDEFKLHDERVHSDKVRTNVSNQDNLMDEANEPNKSSEKRDECEKRKYAKECLNKQIRDLKIMNEVASEVFNGKMDAKEKEIEQIKKEKSKSNDVVLKEIKEQLSR